MVYRAFTLQELDALLLGDLADERLGCGVDVALQQPGAALRGEPDVVDGCGRHRPPMPRPLGRGTFLHLAAGDALHHEAGVGIDENGHGWRS